MRLGLSKRKHLPCLFLDQNEIAFPLWSYRLLAYVEQSHLKLDKDGIFALAEVREGAYSPPFSLVGKTVLDLGACCGETAWFYLRLGAAKVYCVECNPDRISILEENKKNNGLNVEVIPEPLKIEHLLKFEYDFIKCDVEGAETILLDYMKLKGPLKPCVLEVHGEELKKRFIEERFRVSANTKNPSCWIMNNWHNADNKSARS